MRVRTLHSSFLTALFFCGLCFQEGYAQNEHECADLEVQYDDLYASGNLPEALRAFGRFSDCLLQTETDTSLQYALSIHWIGEMNAFLGNDSLARAAFEEAIQLFKAQKREDTPEMAMSVAGLGDMDMDADEHFDAINNYQQALKILRRHAGKECNAAVPRIYGSMGIAYSEMGEFQVSNELYEAALLEMWRCGIDNPLDSCITLSNLGANHFEQSNYAAALDWYQKSWDVFERIKFSSPEATIDLELSLRENLALTFLELGRFQEARAEYSEALELAGRASNIEREADYLNGLATIEWHLHDYKAAERLYLKASSSYEDLGGGYVLEKARVHENLGILYASIQNYEAAFDAYQKAEQGYLSLAPRYTNSLADFYRSQASAHLALGNTDAAKEVLEKALNLVQKDALLELEIQLVLASACASNGEEKLAIDLYRFILKSMDNHVEIQNSVRCNCHYNLGLSLKRIGDFEKAKRQSILAHECFIEVYDSLHVESASALTQVGEICLELGEIDEAEESLLRAHEILEANRKATISEEEDPVFDAEFSKISNGLGNLYSTIGDSAQANMYYDLAISRAKNSGDLIDLAYALGNQALHISNRDLEKAISFAEQALELATEHFQSKKNPELAVFHGNLGYLHFEKGMYEAAHSHFLQALLLEETHFEDAASLWLSYSNLGAVSNQLGNWAEAEKYYAQSLKLVSGSSQDYSIVLENRAMNFADQGNYSMARKMRSRQLEIERELITRTFLGMSEEQRQLYWRSKNDFVDDLLAFAVESDSAAKATGVAFDALMYGKGLLLDSNRDLENAVLLSGDVNLVIAYNEMKESRRALTRLYAEGSEDESLRGYHENRAKSREKLLSREVAEFTEARNRIQLNWKDVRAGLKRREVAIEFGQYWDEGEGTWRYIAFVLRHNSRRPELVELGSTNELDLEWGATNPKNPEFGKTIDENLNTLYDLLWTPLSSALSGAEVVYYSGTGLLHQLPFHAMYDLDSTGSPHYVLDDVDLHPLSSTRMVAEGNHQWNHSIDGVLLALGFVNYNVIPPTREHRTDHHLHDVAVLATNQEVSRAVDDFSGFALLRGTKEETEAIAEHAVSVGWEVDVWTWKEASEQALKESLSEGVPDVLHLATHGFAYADPFVDEDFRDQRDEMRTFFRVGENPMARVGLVLAGGNLTWMGGDTMLVSTGEDGLLTAAEIAQMDLRGLELVVLSACETGLGELQGMEGTMGLFRALKLAGVENVVQSFWSVPDEQTKELMVAFYQHLGEGLPPHDAFSQARKKLREAYPNQPHLWGAFVLMH